MKTIPLQTWELVYNEHANALLVLVNGNFIFPLTHENITEFLEAVNDTNAPVVSLAQEMVPQQVRFVTETNEDDGTEEDYSVLNWKPTDKDLSRYEIGPKEMASLEFDTPQDRLMFLTHLFHHEAVEWLTLDY